MALVACESDAQGTMNALTPNLPTNEGVFGPYVVGYFNGGVGWTFTPTADLLVTGVSSFSAPQVSIWLGTNQVLASYPVANADGSFETISPLVLLAGQDYAISTQNTNFSSVIFFQVGSTTGTVFPLVSVSSYLTGFGDFNLTTNEQWTPFDSTENTDIISLGPNFQFQVVPEPGVVALSILGLLLLKNMSRTQKMKNQSWTPGKGVVKTDVAFGLDGRCGNNYF